MQELVDELLSFPRGRHDDLLDALSMQLDYLVPSFAACQPRIIRPGSMADLVSRIENRLVGTDYERVHEGLEDGGVIS